MNNLPIWLIQNNLINEHDLNRLTSTLKKFNNPYQEVKVIPFDDSKEIAHLCRSYSYIAPVIVYGATKFIRNLYDWQEYFNSKPMEKKDFTLFIPENFRCSTWMKAWEGLCYNDGACFCKLREAKLASVKGYGQYVFIRPDEDDKSFAGALTLGIEIDNWIASLQYNAVSDKFDETAKKDFDKFLDQQVVISMERPMGNEYRLFVVDGEPIASSQYKRNGYLHKEQYIPKEIYKFALKAIDKWQPCDIFVLDICTEYMSTKPYILEIGCFNSAGFYNANIESIVERLNNYYKYNG